MLVPGVALIAASFVIQFGRYFQRPIRGEFFLTAVRIRFIGIGVLFLGIGLNYVISGLFSGSQVGNIVFGLTMIGFAGLWFYAASDRIFRQP